MSRTGRPTQRLTCRNCWQTAKQHCRDCGACPEQDCPSWCERAVPERPLTMAMQARAERVGGF